MRLTSRWSKTDTMKAPDPEDSVRAALDATAPTARQTLLQLRRLIFETAHETEDCGRLVETLKWGQISYLTQAPKTGSTIRIGPLSDRNAVALYVHCQTNLADQFRVHYESELNIVGKRFIEISTDQPLPEDALGHCIALALTYHKRKGR